MAFAKACKKVQDDETLYYYAGGADAGRTIKE